MTSKPLVSVLLGSIRAGRKSARASRLVCAALADLSEVSSDLIDLADYNLPLLEERWQDISQAPAGVAELAAKIARADALIIVAPEYKNGCPGALKNALDFLPPGAFHRKPVGFCTVSAGGFGGLNCLLQLRMIASALGGLPLPEALTISNVAEALDEAGRPLNPRLAERCGRFLEEVIWHAEAVFWRNAAKAGANGKVRGSAAPVERAAAPA